MRTFWMVVFLLASCSVALGQKDSYTIRNYKAVDGLPQSNVNIMLEDRNGYLWIGTHGGGLARFDGREFKVYTTRDGLLSNIISYLKLDLNHNLWIVHPRGITKFDGLNFKTFKQPGTPSNSRRIRRIFEYSDTLFFTSGLGDLGKIHNDSVYYWSRPFLKNRLARYYHLTPDKSILMYLNDSSFYVRSGKGEYAFTHENKFGRPLTLFNYKNEVWVETDKGYFTVDFPNRDFIKRDLPVENHIVYYDSLNDVFWTHRNMTLMKEKIFGKKVQIDTVISDIDVSQVLVDAEGSTWFATSETGLYKYFLQDFVKYDEVNLRSVSSILVDRQGATWVSGARGLWKIVGESAQSYFDATEHYRNVVFTIKESPSGEIWIGTAYGLGKFDQHQNRFHWYTRDDGLSSATISDIEFDDTGGLWAGTLSGGLNYFDGKSFKSVTTREGLTSNAVTASHFSLHHKKLFVGNEFGVSIIEKDRVRSFTVNGMENTSITSIEPFRDSLLLIGSSGAGVAIYNPRTRAQKVLSTHDGLASDFIYFAATDENGFIWIGSEKGISKIRVNSVNEIVENLHYDYDNGLSGVETNQNAFFLSKKKKLFGLIDGLYQFKESQINKSRSFAIHLTDIEIFYGQDSVRQYADSVIGFFKLPYRPSLPPEKNHITFIFNKVDKRYPKSVKFRYFLENFDKTWSQPSSNHQVTYGNLPPGSYVFKVVATNSQGSWSPPYSYAFTVMTPFYQTASFIVGMFILLAGAITLVLYLRVKQRVNQVMMLERIRAREQETLRKEIARDFHDEMGNQLTRIINYVSLLKLNAQMNGNGNGHIHGSGHDLYTKVEDSAKYLYTGTRDFIWSIDPGNDELSKLFIHIRDFGEKLFEEKNINFRAFNAVKEKIKLPYGFSREANLIFKEAMTNAFKYSSAGNVTLSLSRQNDEFAMSFEDDGIGFSTGEIQKTNGLKNIRERADRIHAILRIHSGKKEGTKIVLQFKLNKTLKYGLAV
ncbi:MAG TPA: two-component regulator propeller domain-containing protein [Chryseosolibacter sp.]